MLSDGNRYRSFRRRHILGFHAAAHRWFCMHHQIGRYSPVRFASATILGARAWFLVAIDALSPEKPAATTQLQAGRPEGGVAL